MIRSISVLTLIVVVLYGLLPAATHAQSATPAATMAAGPRIAVTVDRTQLPRNDGYIFFGRNTVPPGARQTINERGEVGTIVIVVESGELTYEIPGSNGRILRAAGTGSPTEAAAPAGSPFTLTAGDALVYPAQTRVEQNTSDTPTVFLFAVFFEPIGSPEPDPSDMGTVTTEILGGSTSPWPDLPPGPVSIAIQPVRIAAGAMLPTPAGGLQAIHQTSGDPSALLVADNGVRNLGTDPADLLVVALAPETAMAATPAATPVLRTAAPAAPEEVLLTTTFPVARLPQGPAAVEFWRSSWEPGFAYLATDYHPSVSVGGDLVLSGQWGARSDGNILVWRDGRIASVPLEQEVVLNAGEAVIYLDNAANAWIRNAAETTTETVNFAITLGDDSQGPNLGVDWEQSGLSGHDVTVRIARQILAPGEMLSVTPDASAPAIRLVDAGTLEWAVVQPDGHQAAPALQFSQGATMPFVLPAQAGQIELRNAGDVPVVLFTMTMTAADSSMATPAS